jgi:hypothetical protein
MVKSKTLRYTPLVKLAQTEIPTIRQTSPTFIPTAMSHEDEFSSQLIQAVELLTKSFRSNLTTNGTLFPDGVSVPRRTAEFRASLKDARSSHLHLIRRHRENRLRQQLRGMRYHLYKFYLDIAELTFTFFIAHIIYMYYMYIVHIVHITHGYPGMVIPMHFFFKLNQFINFLIYLFNFILQYDHRQSSFLYIHMYYSTCSPSTSTTLVICPVSAG